MPSRRMRRRWAILTDRFPPETKKMGIRIIKPTDPSKPRIVEIFDPFSGKRFSTGKLSPRADQPRDKKPAERS